jgi:hypothetical protein
VLESHGEDDRSGPVVRLPYRVRYLIVKKWGLICIVAVDDSPQVL